MLSLMKPNKKAEGYYIKLVEILLEKDVPFMIGGTYALAEYIGTPRPTKDLDIVSTAEDYPRFLKIFHEVGYTTEVVDANWLAKVHNGNMHADIIFGEKNGLASVESSWFSRARQGNVLGHIVKLVSIEDLIRSKAYIQNRERHDGADVVHLILKNGKTIDWKYLWQSMEPRWQVLACHLFIFWFVYPSQRTMVPEWLWTAIVTKTKEELNKPPTRDKITRGLLISSQYAIDVAKWGYQPARE